MDDRYGECIICNQILRYTLAIVQHLQMSNAIRGVKTLQLTKLQSCLENEKSSTTFRYLYPGMFRRFQNLHEHTRVDCSA